VPAGANFGSVPSRTAVQQLTIEYFQESLLGQHLKIGAWQVAAEVPTVGIEGRRTAEEKPVFRAELVLAPILEPFSLASLQS
jgi:hypothetical protein